MKAIGENKRCSCCKEWKHVSAYQTDKSKSDNLCVSCKVCMNARKRRYCVNNRTRVRELNRQYREANREKERQRNRQYHENNKHLVSEQKRRYRENNREKVAEKAAIRDIRRRVKFKLMEEILASQGIALTL